MSLDYKQWEQLLQAGFCFVSFRVFEECKYLTYPTRQQLEKDNFLVPLDRKSKVVYLVQRWLKSGESEQRRKDKWEYIKQKSTLLSRNFDGFYCYGCCGDVNDSIFADPLRENHKLRLDARTLFIRRCYMLVVSPETEYNNRFWMLWEIFQAIKNRRLIVEENVKPLLEKVGTTPTFATVKSLLEDAVCADLKEKAALFPHIERLFFLGADYLLIPVSEFSNANKSEWKLIQPVPLAPYHVNPARVLMVSHPWHDKHHPDDPENRKLKVIREYLKGKEGQFDYVFFDYRCIDQTKPIVPALIKVDELYSKSHCLCFVHDDYFQRCWCLFEFTVNKLNISSQTLVNMDGTYLDEQQAQEEYPILSWLNDARLVQQMGYFHAFKKRDGINLELPIDLIHLKSQIRSLLYDSKLTNQGDRTVVINLFDSLVRSPE